MQAQSVERHDHLHHILGEYFNILISFIELLLPIAPPPTSPSLRTMHNLIINYSPSHTTLRPAYAWSVIALHVDVQTRCGVDEMSQRRRYPRRDKSTVNEERRRSLNSLAGRRVGEAIVGRNQKSCSELMSTQRVKADPLKMAEVSVVSKSKAEGKVRA